MEYIIFNFRVDKKVSQLMTHWPQNYLDREVQYNIVEGSLKNFDKPTQPILLKRAPTGFKYFLKLC